MKNKLWFVQKRYGWSWTPASWEVFPILFASIGVMIYIFRDIDNFSHSGSDSLITFIISIIIATGVLVAICYKQGESLHWQ